MAIAPHQPSRSQDSVGTSYASPLVLAKGEATGFGGSDRQRIGAASLVASRFDRQRNPSRGFRSSRRQPSSYTSATPAPAQPANAIGQVSIARRTLDARKCTTELCRHFVRVFALSEGERRNMRHNPGIGIMSILMAQSGTEPVFVASVGEPPRYLHSGLTVDEEFRKSILAFRQVGIHIEIVGFGFNHADYLVSWNRQAEAAGTTVH